SSLLPEEDVEALLRDQHQQFVENLAQQKKELQEIHEAALEELCRSYEENGQQTECGNNNHAQPPVAPPQTVDAASMSEVLAALQSLQAEVAGMKRQGPAEADTQTTQPPTCHRRVEESPAASTSPSIPGLPADVTEAVHVVTQQPSHPAYGLTPHEVEVLRLKSRPQGVNPRDKLSSAFPQDYQSWDFTIHEKFTRDWPLYLADHEKTSHALSFLDGDLFIAMHGWLTDPQTVAKLYAASLNELQTTLGIYYQATDAKKELDMTTMMSHETVPAFHARLRALWIRAATPEADRLTKFRASLLPSLADPLMGRMFSTTNELLPAAREVENFCKQCQLDRSRSSSAQSQSSLPYRSGSARSRSSRPRSDARPGFTSRGNASTSATAYSEADNEHNRQYGPVTPKPSGWRGPWWEPEERPAKMMNAELPLSIVKRAGV
ncbi:hypothetical protein KEM55_006857, partial [Ascosphaera atra]